MKLFRSAKQVCVEKPSSVVALGNFDGLHLGHRVLMSKVLTLAEQDHALSLVVSFEPHPVQVLYPEKNHRNLFTRQDLEEQLRLMGLETLVLEPFTLEFAKIKAADFIANFLMPLKMRHLVIGPDFALGHHREGTRAELEKLAKQHGFELHVMAPVMLKGQAVSSSWVRQALQGAQVELVEELLGRPFYLEGVVTTGAGRGRKLEFPTANFQPQNVVIPKTGVYAARAWVKGKALAAVSNLGVAPTFNSNSESLEARLETHILDQNLSLVGTRLRVEFISYLREEIKFPDVSSLVQQIQLDVERAREILKNRHVQLDRHRTNNF